MTKIRRMKKGYNYPNIICYDIETYVINDRMEFRLGVVNCEGFAFTFYDVDLFTNAMSASWDPNCCGIYWEMTVKLLMVL